MEYRTLGGSGLHVSVVGLGCNNFGMKLDKEATAAVVNRAIDSGITLFDTANIYGGAGRSEEFLGAALGDRRRDVIVATKFAGPMGQGPANMGASRRHIFQQVEGSLLRLNTDYIDLYQIHFPDPKTPIEETMRALDDLVRSGKVRYIGCSNFTAWQAVEAQWTARTLGLNPLVSAQNEYNLLDRRIEQQLVPACLAYGMGILPYFPLASGFLTGKYRRGEPPPQGTRLQMWGPRGERVLSEQNFAVLERLEAVATDRGHTMLELAIGWLASQRHVSSVIAGATTPEQVDQNVDAAGWVLNAEDLEAVDAATKGEGSTA